MAVLTKSEIIKLIRQGKLKIVPFDYGQIGAGSIDLHLGKELLIFRKTKKIVDLEEGTDYKELGKKIEMGKEGIVIKPGQFVNGITEEKVKLPKGYAARIEGRSRFARIGLLVHVSSGFIQPGTEGKIVLEIVNFSPNKIRLRPGVKICQIIIEEAKGKDAYAGRFYGQTTI